MDPCAAARGVWGWCEVGGLGTVISVVEKRRRVPTEGRRLMLLLLLLQGLALEE
jgi:hypothetical protein